MSTMISNPGRVDRSSGGRTSGAASGAAAGATAGMAFGPVGAVIGGVVGAIGGFVAGAFADKSGYYKKMAGKWAQQGKDREAAIAMRDQLRSYRANRAMALAGIASEEGGTQSSAPVGALASGQAQFGFGKNYTEGQIYIQQKYAKMMRKAGKAADNSNTAFALLDAGTSMASAFGSFYTPSTPSTPPTTAASAPTAGPTAAFGRSVGPFGNG